jgi:translation initiation factor 1
VSNQHNENSFNHIINELDKESARIIISKQIRGKFKKISTVITGIEEKPESLSSELKTKLGTRGTYKEGQIILQGDHIEAVKNLLIKKGFNEQSIEVLIGLVLTKSDAQQRLIVGSGVRRFRTN